MRIRTETLLLLQVQSGTKLETMNILKKNESQHLKRNRTTL